MSAEHPTRAVYTALLGRYEQLLEQAVAATSDVEFICFTDDPELTSSTWQLRLVEPAFAGDSIRSARILKIRGHPSLAEFDETLWIDNSVLLLRDPAELLEQWLVDADFALPAHGFRNTVAAEFDAVLTMGRDDPVLIEEQLASYAERHPERLDREVLWTALLARRATAQTRLTMQVWLDHVLRFSRRDQLSIAHAIEESGQHVHVVDIGLRESTWHRWPVAEGRAPMAAEPPRRWPIESDHVRLARLRAQIDELTVQFNRAVIEREAAIAALRHSRSWRLTAPLRRAGQFARPIVRRMRRRAATD